MFCGEQQLDNYEFLDYTPPEIPTSSLHFSYSTPRALDTTVNGEAEQWSHLNSQLLSSDIDNNLSFLHPENESASPVHSEPGQNHSDNYHLFYSPLQSDVKFPILVTPQELEPVKQCVNMSDITSSTPPSFSDDFSEIKEETPRRPSTRKRGRPPKASSIQNQDKVSDEDQTPTEPHKRPRLLRSSADSGGRNSRSRARNRKRPAVPEDSDHVSDADDYIPSSPSSPDPSLQYDSDSSYEDESRSTRKAATRRRPGYKKHISAAQALRDLERQQAESQNVESAPFHPDSLSTTSSPLSLDVSLPMKESTFDEGFELNLVSEQSVIGGHLGLDMNDISPTSPLDYSSSDHSSRREDNQASRGYRPGRRSTIPQPVPIPNLAKKSRGRKVPVDVQAEQLSPHASRLSLDNPGSHSFSSPSNVMSVHGGIKKTSGERRYVCTVEGCGKCFVRGEHLKRHIRSLHTYDKPHVCPSKGCKKTFSRRDNLAQHVKTHL